jgi:hypothetical protein
VAVVAVVVERCGGVLGAFSRAVVVWMALARAPASAWSCGRCVGREEDHPGSLLR